MNPLADIVAAPVLYTVNGEVKEISPLSHADLGAISRFVQFREYNLCRDLDCPEEFKRDTFDRCLKMRMNLSDLAALAIALNTLDGLQEVAYLALRHTQPNTTREQVGSWLADDVSRVASIASLLTTPPTGLDDEKKRAVAETIRKLANKEAIPQPTLKTMEPLSPTE